MAALVQTIPQQTSSVLLQTRPSSASASGTGTFTASSQVLQQPISRPQTMSLGGAATGAGSGSYRTNQAMPVAPYAFTTTPGLVNTSNGQQRPPSALSRPESQVSPPAPTLQKTANGIVPPQRLHHFTASSVSSSSSNSSHRSCVSQDDSVLSSKHRPREVPLRPLSTVGIPSASPFLNISSPTGSAKPSPDRYRRGNRRAENAGGPQPSLSSGSNALTSTPARRSSTSEDSPPAGNSSLSSLPPSRAGSNVPGHVRVPSADDTRPEKAQSPDLAKRYRRRSWAMDAAGSQMPLDPSLFSPLPDLKLPHDATRPKSAHTDSRNLDTQSVRSSIASVERESGTTQPPEEEVQPSGPSQTSESSKRSANPSPLSKLVTVSPDSPTAGKSTASTNKGKSSSDKAVESPSVQRLTNLANMDAKRPGKSRLRRAFSFGSASELRKASVQNRRELVEPDKDRQQQLSEELGPEQAAIAAQQEANGLGENIYSNTSRFFAGSTDNLSISSTASSASIMLRKMGRGMKKSTRSLVGLFRPKSLIGNNADPITIEPMAPQVSVVNVEAEPKTLSVIPDPPPQASGGEATKVEIPSMDKAPSPPPAEQSNADATRRRSITGGDEREALAAVKKGILKNSGQSSPVSKPVEPKIAVEPNPPRIALSNDSPHSSAPSTPDNHSQRAGHRRTDSVLIDGEDYFLPPGKVLVSESKSAPITPQPVVTKSIVFSPRIQFHETWPSVEYDRRGDIATCNRLTPLIAQQIKEEINTFKMEMEVHETSKVYTHFL
ncbi:hypothetical protein V8E54_011777 [Elaphomyces granulatus]